MWWWTSGPFWQSAMRSGPDCPSPAAPLASLAPCDRGHTLSAGSPAGSLRVIVNFRVSQGNPSAPGAEAQPPRWPVAGRRPAFRLGVRPALVAGVDLRLMVRSDLFHAVVPTFGPRWSSPLRPECRSGTCLSVNRYTEPSNSSSSAMSSRAARSEMRSLPRSGFTIPSCRHVPRIFATATRVAPM